LRKLGLTDALEDLQNMDDVVAMEILDELEQFGDLGNAWESPEIPPWEDDPPGGQKRRKKKPKRPRS